jgi:hypothetical protein
MTTTISRLLVCSTASIAALLAGRSAQAATQCYITFSDYTALYNAANPSTDLCARSETVANTAYSQVCGSKSVNVSSNIAHFHLGMKNASFACYPPANGFGARACNYADPDGHGYGRWKWTGTGACPTTTGGPNCVVPNWCAEARSAVPHDANTYLYIYTPDLSYFSFQQIRVGQFSYYFANYPVSTNDINLYWWDNAHGYYQVVPLKAPPRGNGYYQLSNIYTNYIAIGNANPSLPGFNIDDFTVTTY